MNQKSHRGVFNTICPLLLLTLAFCLCRYLFFPLHGMVQFPLLLFVLGVMVLLFAAALHAKVVAYATTTGYLLGFFSGMVLHTQGNDPGGGKTSSWWLIWGGVYLASILFGLLLELALHKRQGK